MWNKKKDAQNFVDTTKYSSVIQGNTTKEHGLKSGNNEFGYKEAKLKILLRHPKENVKIVNGRI